MKLVVPSLPQLPPGVTLEVGPIEPLPFDLMEWRNRVLSEGLAGAQANMVSQEQSKTRATGWPCALFVTDVARDGKVVERRLHVFYMLLQHGAVAALRGEPAQVDAVLAEAKDLLLEARPDWTTEEVSTLAQLWEGFES